MKVAKKNIVLSISALLLASSLGIQKAQAVWWASEPTQMQNNIALLISNIMHNAYQYADMAETIERRIREIEQIRVATENFRHLSPDAIRNLSSIIQDLEVQREQFDTITNCNIAIDAAIAAKYPGYKEFIEGNGQNADYFQKNYLVLKQTVHKEIANALEQIRLSDRTFRPEMLRRGNALSERLTDLLGQENTSQQVADTVAQLAVLQFQELEEIRNLTGLQSGAIVAANAKAEQEKAAEQRSKERERRAVNRFFNVTEEKLDKKYHMDQVEAPRPPQ